MSAPARSALTRASVLAWLAGCGPGPGDVAPPAGTLGCGATNAAADDARGLDRTFSEWRAAVRASDAEALAALVTEDAAFWSHQQPELRGRAAVADAFRTVFDAWSMDQAFECVEATVDGDLAFVRGTEVNRLTPAGGGDPVEVHQRAFSVLRRSADGRWRFARGMTNAPPG